MSDALNYLIAARPDAITPYFKFLKEAGKHLDTRTRDLISVITKVDAQTEPGFRQYLTRALRNGASANEVLDALLMAFPTLGLAKIVWAIDILLDMDIPEFHPDQLDEFIDKSKNSADGWITFYWGKSLEDYRDNDLADRDWLEFFASIGPDLDYELNETEKKVIVESIKKEWLEYFINKTPEILDDEM